MTPMKPYLRCLADPVDQDPQMPLKRVTLPTEVLGLGDDFQHLIHGELEETFKRTPMKPYLWGLPASLSLTLSCPLSWPNSQLATGTTTITFNTCFEKYLERSSK